MVDYFFHLLAVGYGLGLQLGLVIVFTVSFLSYSLKYFFPLVSSLALTTFGAEYCLIHSITHHPSKTDTTCSAVPLRQLSYLFDPGKKKGFKLMMKDASLVWTLCYTRKQPHPWRIPAAAKFVCRLYGDTKCDSLNELRTSLSKSRERSTCKENAPNSRQFHVASTTCHVPALHLETCPHSDSQYPPQLQRGNSAAAEKPLCRMGQFWVGGRWRRESDNTLHKTLLALENSEHWSFTR